MARIKITGIHLITSKQHVRADRAAIRKPKRNSTEILLFSY
jgi:hypothetical protein